MQLYDVEAEQVITQGKLALGEEARLSWLGFATTGMLCTTDSQGTLRGLAEKQDWQWVPLLDMVPLRKTKVHPAPLPVPPAPMNPPPRPYSLP